MKLYLVAPVIPDGSNEAFINARLNACVRPIAELLLGHIGSDPALFGIRHLNEVSKSPIGPMHTYGYAEAVNLADRESLLSILLACGDPNSGEWMLIRSLVTCRSVYYGYDGQAFVCLPTDSPAIESPDEELISVSDESRLILDTDYMDGLDAGLFSVR